MSRGFSMHQSETEWAEARQMLNDAGLPEVAVSNAVAGFTVTRNRSMLDQAQARLSKPVNSV